MKTIVPTLRWTRGPEPAALREFLQTPPVDDGAERVAKTALESVRRRGDAAVVALSRKFNGVRLTPARFRVGAEEIAAAAGQVAPSFRRAVTDVLARVRRFARAGLRPDWEIRAPRGGRLGERFVPLARVGAYIPGGASPLASTALMTVPLARVAGVPEVIACTPSAADGRVDPHILHALDRAGATAIFRLGGIQAIGAMAYGTATVPRVDKIVGPGGPFVTAAKRLVYGGVALDMVAGPSEIAVLADDTAPAAAVAADLLSQAEHGTGRERTLLVTTSARLAAAVAAELARQSAELPRADRIRTVLATRSLTVITDTLERGVAVINAFGPEHLEVLVEHPRRLVPEIRTAGAIFLGPWTPEPAGDFAAGPSHVLPTGGSARYFSGLTVEDFRRRMSVLELTRGDLVEMRPIIAEFARVEQLPAHGRSAEARFGKSATAAT